MLGGPVRGAFPSRAGCSLGMHCSAASSGVFFCGVCVRAHRQNGVQFFHLPLFGDSIRVCVVRKCTYLRACTCASLSRAWLELAREWLPHTCVSAPRIDSQTHIRCPWQIGHFTTPKQPAWKLQHANVFWRPSARWRKCIKSNEMRHGGKFGVFVRVHVRIVCWHRMDKSICAQRVFALALETLTGLGKAGI